MTTNRDDPIEYDAAPIRPAALPAEIAKQKRAINLYFIAVGALAVVVVLIPVLSIFGREMQPEIWAGWNVAMGGLIALIGAQSGNQAGA
jgi:hypothetical protein